MYGLAPPARSNTLSFVLAIPHRSFRWIACRLVPASNPRKRAAVGVVLLLAAGCGGGGGTKERVVRGEGFTFSAPAAWTVERRGGVVELGHGTDLVSVTPYSLLRRLRLELLTKIVRALDRTAASVARQT